VGYLITGVKDVRQSKVGDTVTTAASARDRAAGRLPRPQADGVLRDSTRSTARDYPDLREALDKLQLNDAALQYEPETSVALGLRFRCGFLGLLHLEITRSACARVRPRPDLHRAQRRRTACRATTAPSRSSPTRRVRPTGKVARSRAGRQGDDPRAQEFVGADHGAVPVAPRRARRHGLPRRDRVELRYNMPLGEIIFDFFDR
jgi:GTP-binding protein LepA